MDGQIADHFIYSSTSLRDAMLTIEATSPKIALVVDERNILSRTVTDGDIRRALLRGASLTSPVADLGSKSPVTCLPDTCDVELKRLLDEEGVTAIVMVSSSGTPVRIVDRAKLQGVTLMSPPHIGSHELDFVRAAFEDNWIAPAGPNLVQFEHKLEELSGRSHALAVSSGTAALHLALRCVGVRGGDRVYVSDLTFAASVQPILYEGATPVLIDSEPSTWNMSPDALGRQLAIDAAGGTLPRAIMIVHIYGQPARIQDLVEIAGRYEIPVIEDAAESLGAHYKSRPSGAHGVLAAYSFNGNKIVTTSGGGALVGDDAKLMNFARFLSTQGRDACEHYQHAEVAYNYRMSNVLAGIGIGQLELISERVSARRAIFNRYREALGIVKGISFQEEAPDSMGNRWLTVVRLNPDFCALHPFAIMRELRQSGIETRPGWKPMHMQPLCSTFEFVPHDEQAPVSSSLFFQSLCLPSGSSLDRGEQDRIIDRILELVGSI